MEKPKQTFRPTQNKVLTVTTETTQGELFHDH